MEIPDFSNSGLPEKEQRILQAAIKVFSEKGFSAATTSEIAKNAGIAEGTVFRYFKTKKDILKGILIQTIRLLSGTVVMAPIEKILGNSENKDIREILREIIYDRIKLFDSLFPMLRVVVTEAIFHDDVRDAIYHNIILRALDAFKAFHKKMLEQGVVREDVDSETVFRCILGNIGMLIAQRRLFGDKFPAGDLEQDADRIIDVILYGIYSPKKDDIQA